MLLRGLYTLLMHTYGGLAILRMRLRGSKRSLKSCYGVGLPPIKGSCVWFHAVSMGETKAIAPLVQRLKSAYPDTQIIFSSITETGHQEVKRSLPEVDHAIFLPFDIPHVMRHMVRKARPKLLVMSETDLWPAFLGEARRYGAKVAVVNAKISRTTARWHRRLKPLKSRLFGRIDRFCLQCDLYDERLGALKIPQEKRVVTGNLKFDARPSVLSDDARRALRQELSIPNDAPVVVIGSSHDPEEKQLLKALRSVWTLHPNLKVILVPRHPERFDAVASLLEQENISYVRYTKREVGSGMEKVILVDAMGLLNQCYQIGSVAIVAGSFTKKVGGHNILEPLWFGVPTLFGPHMHSQANMSELVLSHNAGMQTSAANVGDQVEQLLSNPDLRRHLGDGAARLLSSLSGSVDRTWCEIKNMIAT